jgi:hypothetical protein
MELIEKILEFMKEKVGYFFGIACAFSILIFAPDGIINNFGLLEYRERSKPYFGISLLILIAIIIANFIDISCNFIRKYRKIRARNKRLNNLTYEEKNILNLYVEQETKAQNFDYRNGIVNGLVCDNIIYRSSSLSVNNNFYEGIEFAYNIHPWAWEYLNKNINLLSHKN